MHFSTYAYARLRRQYRHLGKQLARLVRQGQAPPPDWLARFRKLTRQLGPKIGQRGLARALGSAAGVIGLGMSLHAQLPVLAEPVVNPFGLDTTGVFFYNNPNLVDIDNDGDLDLFMGAADYTTDEGFIAFHENIGTATVPEFAPIDTNMVGFKLEQAFPYLVTTFGDFDQDGDLDILSTLEEPNGYYSVNVLRYFENIGTPASPEFAAAVVPPFDLPSAQVGNNYIQLFLAGDIDADGDVDVLSFSASYDYGMGVSRETAFYENIAEDGLAIFAAPVNTPFGTEELTASTAGNYLAPTQLVDLDGDGDLDLLGQSNNYDYETEYYVVNILFVENEGSPVAADFGELQYTPAGEAVEAAGSYYSFSSAGDLDGDGDVDIISAAEYLGFLYYENLATDVSVREQSVELEIDVFPNPTSGQLNLRTREDIRLYQLFDAQGREVLQAPANTTELILSELPPGQYWLKATTKELTFGTIPILKE